jgi:hypothetical protein
VPESTKISFVEWWKYETSVFYKACRETSKASLGRLEHHVFLVFHWPVPIKQKIAVPELEFMTALRSLTVSPIS